MVEGNVLVPLCMNCGLSVAPWFYRKAMKLVVPYFRKLGHRIFSYLDDFFRAAKPGISSRTHTQRDTQLLGQFMEALFTSLGLQLHARKCWFERKTRQEILGIVVDTVQQMFLLSPFKLAKIELSSRLILTYAANHRR